MRQNADAAPIAAGIASAGESLGRGLAGIAERMEKRKEEEKQRRQRGKAASSFYRASPELQQALGQTPDAFDSLSDDDKQAAVAGGINALSLMREQTRAAQQKAQYDREMNSGAALQQMAGATAQGNLEQLYENPELYQGAPAFDQALFRNPAAVNAPNFNEFSRAVMGQNEGRGSMFRRDDLGKALPTGVENVDFIPTSKGGGQLLDRRPTEPKANDEGVIEIPDPNDPVFGPRMRIPISVARKSYPHLLKALDAPAAPAATPEPAKGGTAINYDDELKRAQNAIAQGRSRAKVAEIFKARTGKDLP